MSTARRGRSPAEDAEGAGGASVDYGDDVVGGEVAATIHSVVYAYTLGKNLIFASNNLRTVEAVGLYDGSDPHVDKPGGSLSYAGFITLSEVRCY